MGPKFADDLTGNPQGITEAIFGLGNERLSAFCRQWQSHGDRTYERNRTPILSNGTCTMSLTQPFFSRHENLDSIDSGSRTNRRNRIGLKRILSTCVACLALTVCSAGSSHAAWLLTGAAAGEADDEEALVLQWTDPESDVSYLEVFYKDGSKEYFVLINPDPTNGTTTPGDESTWGQLAKQKGGHGYLIPVWQDTPLGQFVGDKGPGNYYHPSDEDGGSGGLSPSKSSFFNPTDFAEEMYAGGGVAGGNGFDPNGGSVGSQLKGAIRRGNNGDDGDGDSGGQPSDGGLWDDDMPGPPELVNPATRRL